MVAGCLERERERERKRERKGGEERGKFWEEEKAQWERPMQWEAAEANIPRGGGGGGGERQDKSSERCLSVASSPFGPFAERALPRCHRLIQAHHGRVGTQTHMLLHFAEDKGRKKRSDFHHLVRHLCASMSLCERHNLEHDVTMRGRVQASMQASMHMHVQASMQSCKHPCTCTS